MPDNFQKIAAHGFIKFKNKYLVTRRSLVNDYKPGEWDIPGGTIEFDEDPAECLKREFLEETNLKIKNFKPVYICSQTQGLRHQIWIVYECEYKSGKVKLNPEEHDKFVWATIAEIKKLKKIAFLNNFYRVILSKHKKVLL